MPVADVSLRAAFERVDDVLRVEYELRNDSGGSIGVFDGAGGPPEEEWPNLTGSVYVSLEARDLVSVKRVLAPLPKEADIDVIVLPPASRLDPGRSRSVRFALTLPLAERSEYFPAHAGADWRDHEVGVVRLVVGFRRAQADAVFQPRPKNPQLFKLASGFGPQEYVWAERPLALPVRVRLDKPFERV